MIYYNDALLNLREPKSPIEIEVSAQLQEIEAKYFGQKSKGVAILRWDQGKRVRNESGEWEPKRIYPIKLLSSDGLWRYTKTKAKTKKGGDPVYIDNFVIVKDETLYHKEDVELIWYFSYHSSDFKVKILRFDDPAKVAEQQVADISDDSEIKFYLFGKTSELAKNEDDLRSIAEAFGIDNIHTLNIDELKIAIYDLIRAGQKRGDKSCNYDVFMEFTQAAEKHKYASLARRAIKNGDLVFNKNEYAWFLKGLDDAFLKLKGTEIDSSISLVVDKVIKSTAHAVALMKFYNEDVELSADAIKTMKRPDLQRIAKANEVKYSNGDKTEELAQKIIDTLGLS